ncbi:MAG: thioredoxin family protein [Candidatus Kapabacteria bacterium]|nr:thioredoxin family protein [Candidatus Kapabacteria bacterium]
MNLINLNIDNFESVINNTGIVLVDCWAAWCSACKDFKPIFEKTAANFPTHTFGMIDTMTEKDLVSLLKIEHIPTLLLYRDGIMLFKQPGYFSEDKLEDIIKQAESLNMDLVRADLESQKS